MQQQQFFKGRLGARHAHARPFGVRPLSFGSWGEIATATRVLSLCHAATRNRLVTTIACMRLWAVASSVFITCAHYDPESDVLLALLIAPFDPFLHRRLLLLLDPNPPELHMSFFETPSCCQKRLKRHLPHRGRSEDAGQSLPHHAGPAWPARMPMAVCPCHFSHSYICMHCKVRHKSTYICQSPVRQLPAVTLKFECVDPEVLLSDSWINASNACSDGGKRCKAKHLREAGGVMRGYICTRQTISSRNDRMQMSSC